MQASDALNATLLFCSVGIVITSCEHLSILKEFGPGGIYTPLLHIDRKAYRASVRTPAWSWMYSRGAIGMVLAIQLLIALVVIGIALMTQSVHLHPSLLWCLAAFSSWVHWRRRIGGDGAEQMTMLVLVSSAIDCTFQPIETRCQAAVIFLAAQSCLSYLVAGIAKLASPLWRSGTALENIIDTNTFGSGWMAAILRKRRWASRALNWTVMIGESAFSLVLIAPRKMGLAMLGAGTGFHLANAAFMGLNDFFWSFVATYPCIYWTAQEIHAHGH